jgi:peptidoglycan hydrolase CwlO-like protein
MDNKITTGLICVLIIGVIIVSGCTQEGSGGDNNTSSQQSQQETVTRPDVTAQEIISELQDVKSSINEIGEYLSE